MKHRRFTSDDQLAFAELSGDYNPLHIDAIAARRSLFGAQVVHGIHSLLWGLDWWLEGKTSSIQFRSVKTVFPKPVRVGDQVSLLIENHGERRSTIKLQSGGSTASITDIEWTEAGEGSSDFIKAGFPDRRQPRCLSDNEIETASGTLDLYLNIEAAGKIFPNLVGCVSPLQIAIILSTTRLVGVECPGARSMYSSLNLSSNDLSDGATMKYEVTKLDRRFGLASISVSAPGMAGAIKAFIRPSHQDQAACLELKKFVESNEFKGQRALVIGGSRGLGEVSAKLLAAGGADVKITYHQGMDDALRVVRDINSNGGISGSIHVNVLSPEQDSLLSSLDGWAPTHLYYFATRFIFSGVKGVFSGELFTDFCDYYIFGFINIVDRLRRLGLRNVFYPSTVAIDELPPDMGEYTAAKTAGEVLCMYLKKGNKDMTVYCPRLDRMSTDQTVSLLHIRSHDPAPVMLEHLRKFRDASAPK